MKQKAGRRLASVLLTLALAMAVGLLLVVNIPAYADENTWNEDMTFDSDTTINDPVTVSKDIKLTINEGVTLTVNGGIDASGRTVTVLGGGTLKVYGSNAFHNAFIGNIVVNNKDAHVYAYGGTANDGSDCPAYHGDAYVPNGGDGGTGGTAIKGNVTVYNGYVTAIGGKGGHGGKGSDVWHEETGRGSGMEAGRGGHGGTGGTGIDGWVLNYAGVIDVTGGEGGAGGEGGYAYGGTDGNGGNGGAGGVAVRYTVTVNGNQVSMTGGVGGEGGYHGHIWLNPSPVISGEPGSPGQAIKGTIGGKNATISVKDANTDWEEISSLTTQKQYVKVTAPVSAMNLAFDKTYVTVDERSAIALKAVFIPVPADNRVKWSVGSDGDNVKLYADAECSNEIGSDETDTLMVYVKGLLSGTAKVTVTSVADSSLFATCDVNVEHAHKFDYRASGDTITATCVLDYCPFYTAIEARYTETLKIVPPAAPVYNGTAFPATLALEEDRTAFGEFTALPAIEYERKTGEGSLGDPTQDAPVDAGEYRASITLQPTDGTPATVTASVTYTIQTAAMDISAVDWEGVYDGGEHAITVTVNAPEGTQIAYRTADSGEYDLTENPTFTEAGTYTVYYRVTKANYTAVEDSSTVQIDNATLTRVNVIPLGDLTYTGEEQTQIVHTEADSVNSQPVTFAYSRTLDGPFGDMPTVTNVSDSGTFYYKASAPNHDDFTGEFTVTVKKCAILEVVTPTPAAVTYAPNRTLADVVLPTNWAWEDGSIIPTVGNAGYNAALSVEDDNYDYTRIEGYDAESHSVRRTVDLTVNKAEVAPPVIPDKPYTGTKQTADVEATEWYTVTQNEGGIRVGTYDVVLTLTDPDNYRWTTSNEASITLDFQIRFVVIPTTRSVTYAPDQTLQDVPLELDEAYDRDDWDWKWADPSVVPVVNNSGYEAVLEKEFGGTSYTLTRTISLTVKPAIPTVTEPTIKEMIYNGKAQELVNGGSTRDGTLYYAATTIDMAPDDAAYTESIPAATDDGTYYVWYKVVGDDNHLDTEAACVTASIVMPEFGDPDFAMPEDLAVVEESAFEGVTSVTVVDAHSCASIGQDAFKGTGLKKIRLPKDCAISDAAFDEDGLVYIFAPSGGTTQSYCAERDNLVFIAE